MARIVLTTYGSSGDLNPIVALGLGLQARGHAVLIAVEEAHRPAVAAAGLAVHPLPGDNEAVLWPYRRVLFGDISPVAFTRILLEHSILPTLHETVDVLRAACDGADLLISTMQQAAAGIVADVTGLPWVSLALSPPRGCRHHRGLRRPRPVRGGHRCLRHQRHHQAPTGRQARRHVGDDTLRATGAKVPSANCVSDLGCR